MPETLLSPSNVVLFGRIVEDLDVVVPNRPPPAPPPPGPDPRHGPFAMDRTGPNRFLETQLADPNVAFARIYGFSYEGRYYDLPWPTLFLVHGPGVPAETVPGAGRVSRAPEEPDHTGMAAQDFSLADNLMAWSYDRADLSIRMDVDSGSFEQILLDLILGGGGGPSVSGVRARGPSVSGVRVRGVRVAGVRARGGRDGDSGD